MDQNQNLLSDPTPHTLDVILLTKTQRRFTTDFNGNIIEEKKKLETESEPTPGVARVCKNPTHAA